MCEKKEVHRIVSWSVNGGRKGEGKGEGRRTRTSARMKNEALRIIK